MRVQKEISSYYDLKQQLWSGALDTLETIEEHNKEQDFFDMLEYMFDYSDETPTLTELNDYVWFDRENIYTELDIDIDE